MRKVIWFLYSFFYDLLLDLIPYQIFQQKVFNGLRITNNIRVLDAGCGTGNTIFKIAKNNAKNNGIEFVALDACQEMLDRCKKKNKEQSIVFVLGGLDDCDVIFRGWKFDRIISTNSLYASENYEKVLKDWFDLLKDSGILVLTNPVRPKLFDIFGEHFRIMHKEKRYWDATKFLFKLPLWLILIILNLIIANLAKNKKMHFIKQEVLIEKLKEIGFEVLNSEIIYGNTVALFICQKGGGAGDT